MQLFIVSLARSASRREQVLRNNFGGISHAFFDAFDASIGGHEAVSRYDEATAIRKFGVALAPGEVACFASHYALWQHCMAIGQPIGVMEDDVDLSPSFEQAFNLAAKHIVARRFIRLAGLHQRPFRLVGALDDRFNLVRFKHGPAGTQCYCISPEGAARLLKHAGRWHEPVDLYIDSFWRHGLAALAILPFEAREHEANSLDTTISGRQVRRSGWAKYRREATRLVQGLQRFVFNALDRGE